MTRAQGSTKLRTIVTACAVGVFVGETALAQNLVPNPGFEVMDEPCLGDVGYYNLADWINPICSSGANYLNQCSTDQGWPNAGVPSNFWGSETAVDGMGYCGTLTYKGTNMFPPEDYASVPLIQPLVAGTEYCFSLHASLAGRSTYRSETLSAIFTTYYPTTCDGNDTLNWPTETQIVFDLATVDTTGWTLLTGSFTASGGERYLTIGNFTTPYDPDTVFVGWTNAPYVFAFYYLDAVELRTCESGIGEDDGSGLRVFPNPADERVMIEVVQEALGATVTLADLAGRVVFQQRMNTTTASIDVADLARGCYSLHLTNATTFTTVKLILE